MTLNSLHFSEPSQFDVVQAKCIFDPEKGGDKVKSAEWIIENVMDQSCDDTSPFDVVTVIGPLAEGKSHSLNQRIFNNEFSHFGTEDEKTLLKTQQQIFPEQKDADGPGTLGLWCAFQFLDKFLVFDTQGFNNGRSLAEVSESDATAISAVGNAVKLMAISDVVIFHTSAPRIVPNETFRFLKEACPIVNQWLSPNLSVKKVPKPLLIVFHQVLKELPMDESKLRSIMGEEVCKCFSGVRYMPVVREKEADFGALNAAIAEERNSQRCSTQELFKKAFNALFQDEIMATVPTTFTDRKSMVPVELFACPAKCFACGLSCDLLRHSPSKSNHQCRKQQHCSAFSEKYNNRCFYCKKCGKKAETSNFSPDDFIGVKVFSYFAQYSTVINCEKCKTIYRSDDGDWPPRSDCATVETRLFHVWRISTENEEDGSNPPIAASAYYGRALLDPLADVTDYGWSILKPKADSLQKMVKNNVRPAYWIPDDEANQCRVCSNIFNQPSEKHHCRQCGEIVCAMCSTRAQPVPERGWGEKPVRVCDKCFGTRHGLGTVVPESNNVNSQWALEQLSKVYSVAGSVTGAIGDTVLKQTNPDYWQKETDPGAHQCNACGMIFDKNSGLQESGVMQDLIGNGQQNKETQVTLGNSGMVVDQRRHHCRACGKYVCGPCSIFRMKVPERGWCDREVRVCTKCYTGRKNGTTSSLPK